MSGGQSLQTLVDQIGEALVSWTVAGEITTWNQAAEQLLGYRGGEIIGRNVGLLVPVSLLAEHEDTMRKLLREGGTLRLTTSRCAADGRPLRVSLSLSRICDEGGAITGVGCLLQPRDPTSRLINRLWRRAFTDPLTGALNRAGLEDRMTRMPQAGRSAIVFIDLDGFKQVNDGAGHHRGDQLLRRCASRIRSCLPEGHTLTRWGGDEFVVVIDQLPDSVLAAHRMTETLCSALLDALRPAYRIERRLFGCPASIGACCYRPQFTTHHRAMQIADTAMYRVKNGGKNAFHVMMDESPSASETVTVLRPRTTGAVRSTPVTSGEDPCPRHAHSNI
ncbi:MAG: diguanylate cyclase [Steroidobacteraceae bacterium]